MKIREYRSTDLERVLDIHMFAFKEHLNVLLGREYNRQMLAWFNQDRCVYFVAEDDAGFVIGYVFGAPWGYQRDMNKDLLNVAIKSILLRPWIVFNPKILRVIWIRLKTILGVNRKLHQTEVKYDGKIFSMIGMGIAPGTLRKGLGVSLYKRALISARDKGYNFVRVTVNRTNIRSRGMHEKIGFQIEQPDNHPLSLGYYIDLSKLNFGEEVE